MKPEDEVYKKVGKRYVSLGYHFRGFPVEGLWLVEDGRRSLIMKVGALPDPYPLAALERHRDRIQEAVKDFMSKAIRETAVEHVNGGLSITFPSLHDVVTAMFMAVAKAEQP
jgi:hypothetical protein